MNTAEVEAIRELVRQEVKMILHQQKFDASLDSPPSADLPLPDVHPTGLCGHTECVTCAQTRMDVLKSLGGEMYRRGFERGQMFLGEAITQAATDLGLVGEAQRLAQYVREKSVTVGIDGLEINGLEIAP